MRWRIEKNVLSVQVNGRWRKVGDLDKDKLIITKDYIEHFSMKYNGYGFYYDILTDDRIPKLIQIDDKNGIPSYILSRESMVECGIKDEDSNQLFLSLEKIDKLNLLT